jgi:hypothetical protein
VHESDPRDAVGDRASRGSAIVGHAAGGHDGARGGVQREDARVRCRQ